VANVYDRRVDYRARLLAQLPELGLDLPAAVRYAISGYRSAQAIRAPAAPLPRAAERALADLALNLAHSAVEGKRPGALPGSLDVSAVAAARAAEQETLDRIALVGELRNATSVVLCQVAAGDNGRRIIAAIQQAHGETVAELTGHLRSLPAGVDDQVALAEGEPVRSAYLAGLDLAERAARLRQALVLVEGAAPPREIPDGFSQCAAYERSGRLHSHWNGRTGTIEFGPFGSFAFWDAACRIEPPLDFWLPATAEAEARASELREQAHVEHVRLTHAM
jgi:hypothetical protein